MRSCLKEGELLGIVYTWCSVGVCCTCILYCSAVVDLCFFVFKLSQYSLEIYV